MRGGVSQVKVPTTTSRGEGVNYSLVNPTTTQTREVGQAVYVAGPTEEVAAGPQVSQVRQEQLVMGEVQQQVVEIPTVQVVEQIQEIPEIQTVERHVEVPQVVQEMVEQIVEQVVEVPKIIPQKRIQQRTIEQIVDVPKIIPQKRIQQRTIEQIA